MSALKFIENTKTAIASHTTRELAVFGFCVLLSAIAWFMQVLHENYEVEVTIPLRLTDVPDDVVITDSLPDNLQIKVGDRGTTLFTSFYLSSAQAVEISFSDFPTPNNISDVRINRFELQRRIEAALPTTTTIQSEVPDSLHFRYSRHVMR